MQDICKEHWAKLHTCFFHPYVNQNNIFWHNVRKPIFLTYLITMFCFGSQSHFNFESNPDTNFTLFFMVSLCHTNFILFQKMITQMGTRSFFALSRFNANSKEPSSKRGQNPKKGEISRCFRGLRGSCPEAGLTARWESSSKGVEADYQWGGGQASY